LAASGKTYLLAGGPLARTAQSAKGDYNPQNIFPPAGFNQ
jgi:hypothetical protein